MAKNGKKYPVVLVVINEDAFFCQNFLLLFQHIARNGYTIYVAAKAGNYKSQIEAAGFRFISIPVKRKSLAIIPHIRLLMALIKIYRKIKPDIIHHVTIKIILEGMAAAFITRSRAAIVNHFCGLGHIFTLEKNNNIRRLVTKGLRVVLRIKASVLLFENREDREEVVRLAHFDPEKAFVVPGTGIDLNEYGYCPVVEKAKLQILLPARMITTKGVYEFIHAAKINKPLLAGKATFILAGSTDPDNPGFISEGALRKETQEGYIEWVGFVENIKQLMEQSDIIVLPSYREGLSKSLVEACAIGRPVITTHAPGCRDCVQDGYNGFLVPVHDTKILAEKIMLLVNDRAICRQMGLNSRRLAEEKFDISLVVARVLNIYI